MNFYDSIIDGAQVLSEEERGQLYVAALEYLYYEREPDFDMKPAPQAIFISMRPVFDKQIAKRNAGMKGGKTRAKVQANAKQTSSKPQANAKQTRSKPQANAKQTPSKTQAEPQANAKQTPSKTQTSFKQNSEVHPKKKARFVPPTPEEVDAYIAEKGYKGFDGEGFCAFYASKGWKVGNTPMKNWKQAVVTWHKRRQGEQHKNGGAGDGFDDFRI